MTVREVVTHVFLSFPPRQVWEVLSNLQDYAQWNPLNVAAEGEAVAGTRVAMKFIDPGRPGKILEQQVRVTHSEEPFKLEWLGRVPILFEGRHYFILRPSKGGTELEHGERLSGLIPAFWSQRRMELQRRAYEAMNRALALRLAQLFGESGEGRNRETEGTAR